MKEHGEQGSVWRKFRRIGQLISRRKVVLFVCAVLIIGAAVGNVWFSHAQTNARLASEQKTAQEIARLEVTIEEVKKLKAIEAEAARKAAATKAAEGAINGTLDPSAIDAKVCNHATSHINPAAIDVLVNKKHCIQPLAFAPADLTSAHGATLSAKAIKAFNQFYAAAMAAGQPFYVTSSYRSYDSQIATYNRWVVTSGRKGADTYSARPGYSEHQTGLAFDVAANGCVLSCFGSTPQYKWMQKHAADYGFIQRYHAGHEITTGYKAEEWHYRYVGVAVAKDMKAKGVYTLEEYWDLPGGDY